jgi:hypothetical protein
MRSNKLTRRALLKSGVVATTAGALPLAGQKSVSAAELKAAQADMSGDETARDPLEFRALMELFWHPYFPEPNAPKTFFDKAAWKKIHSNAAACGYNTIVYFMCPWPEFCWHNFILRYDFAPEARDYSLEQHEAIIEQTSWIFRQAHAYGLKNFLYDQTIYTTKAWARAHDLEKDLPVSDTVDSRHNFERKGLAGLAPIERMYHTGVRSELTRKFTEDAIAELFEIYPEMDGLYGTMGEPLPGKRSTWFKEAIAPGLKRTGRNPPYVLYPIMPKRDFINDIAPKDVYDNVWPSLLHNGEIITDIQTYPISARWARESGLPTVLQLVFHNTGHLTWNSPRYISEMMHEIRKVDHCAGILSHITGTNLKNPTEFSARAIGYYSKNHEPYSDEPWIGTLEELFGDRAAAQHFLNALNVSGYITPALSQIAWYPHDGRAVSLLSLRYWYWADQQKLMKTPFVSPGVADILIPVRYYAEVVAKQGERYRNNDGSILKGGATAQGPMWGNIDYQVTPEMHMSKMREMGEEALQEAEAAMQTVKKNKDQATGLYNQMKAYKLLTDYYEGKVLAAVSALIHKFNGDMKERAQAEKLAQEAVDLFTIAANFIYEEIDKKSGNMLGGWYDVQRTLPGLIEVEKKDKEDLEFHFGWPPVWDGKPVYFTENWGSGVIDTEKWIVNVGQADLGSKCQLEQIGPDDWAIFTEGPGEVTDHTTYFYARQTFRRGANLRCTFKTWVDSSKKENWVKGDPANAQIGGPWHASQSFEAMTDADATVTVARGIIPGKTVVHPFNNPEAMVRFWGTPYFAQDGDAWPTGGDALSSDFIKTFEASSSKANALTIRVWLGDEIGAKLEWSGDDGRTWKEEIDTRQGKGGRHGRVYLGFATFGTAVFVDDIVVENDAHDKSNKL